MEKLWDTINYLLGVAMVPSDDVLCMEDCRPTLSMFLSCAGLVAVVIIAACGWLTRTIKVDGISVGEDNKTYMVALCQGMLLRQSDTQILRENAHISRIAAAIANFLGIPREGVVDVL